MTPHGWITPGWMLTEAKAYRNACFARGEAGDVDPETLRWEFVPSFALTALDGFTEDVYNYLAEHYELRVMEGESEDPQGELSEFRRAIHAGTIDPIIVVQATDGRFFVWDGNHRTGTAAALEVGTLPACVGYQVP